MESTKAPKTFDRRRRRFLGTATMTIAAVEFAIGAPARAASPTTNPAKVSAMNATQTSFGCA